MQDIHDERNIPLQPEALTPRESKFYRLMAWLGRRDKNQRDEKVAKATAENAPLRAAEAQRRQHQLGVSDDAAEKFLRMLGRIGRGTA